LKVKLRPGGVTFVRAPFSLGLGCRASYPGLASISNLLLRRDR